MRAVPYAEADLILGLFTESLGRVSAMARRARAPGKRKFHLEPMHTLDVVLSERSEATLVQLSSASMAVPRMHLVQSFDRMKAAGTALRWVRQSTPHRTPEPEVWAHLAEFLDSLDQESLPASPTGLLAVVGLRLLQSLGYALELQACVVCGRPCPEERSAHIDPVRGGLVCRRCGGHGPTLDAATRRRFQRAILGTSVLIEPDLPVASDIVESALLAHANVKPFDPGTEASGTR